METLNIDFYQNVCMGGGDMQVAGRAEKISRPSSSVLKRWQPT